MGETNQTFSNHYSDGGNNNTSKRSLVQTLLLNNKVVKPKLDKVDQSFNAFQESLENQDIESLMKMYAEKSTILCGYEISTFTKHSDMIDNVLLKQLQAVVQENIVLTHEQYQVLMNLEKRDIN